MSAGGDGRRDGGASPGGDGRRDAGRDDRGLARRAHGSPRRRAPRRTRAESDDPVPVRDLLRGATGSLGVRDPVATGRLWAAWADIVGPAIAGRAEPTSLRDGVLRVRAESPAWATEIGYLADEIRRRADEVVGRGTVVEVRVWTGPPPRRPAASASAPESAPAGGPVARRAEPVTARDAGGDDAGNDASERDPAEALERARRAWARRRARRS